MKGPGARWALQTRGSCRAEEQQRRLRTEWESTHGHPFLALAPQPAPSLFYHSCVTRISVGSADDQGRGKKQELYEKVCVCLVRSPRSELLCKEFLLGVRFGCCEMTVMLEVIYLS